MARRFGLIADIPYWEIAALLLAAVALSSVNVALWSEARTGWRVTARMTIEMVSVGLVIYGIGWGPALAIGFVFGAADGMRSAGSSVAKPAMAATVGCIGLGQLAIGLGWAPSLISQPLVHWLAAMDALGAVMTIKVLEWFAVGRESSEQRFRMLVQHASDIIVVTDRNGHMTYVSPSFERLLGRSPHSYFDRSAGELLHEDDLANLRDLAPLSDGREETRREVRLRHASGSWKWFEATITNHLGDSSVRGVVSNLHDISERKRAEDDLREAHQLFRSAFDHVPIGMAISDLTGNVLSANSAYASIVGLKPDELVGHNVHDLTHPDDRQQSIIQMRRLIESDSNHYQLEKRYMRPDGQPVWASVNVSIVRDEAGSPLYLIGQIEDVTERRALRERLAHAAIHDPLTDLPNRLLFMDRLESALNRTTRTARRDGGHLRGSRPLQARQRQHGALAGDRLLQAVSRRLVDAIRPADTVARFGGDEFAILCEEVDDERMALEVTKRLSQALEDPIALPEGPAYITASMGVALSRGHEDIAAELLRDADTAMYQAKENGRARVTLFDQQSRTLAVDALRLQGELHGALEQRQFRLFYQPIVEVASGRLAAVEALVRWQHPERGLLHPGEFLAEAEESGLIVPLGDWILEEACRQSAAWEAARARQGLDPLAIGMSVNLSPRQLVEPVFVDNVARILSDVGVDPRSIWLEITEGALAADLESTVRVLGDLAKIGVKLCIDDFGAGYASFGYLSSFPVTTLKIDRSFVAGLGHRPEDETIVASVIDMAGSLGLRCIAEGVENFDQFNQLRSFGCDHVQGFLLGVPLPAEALGPTLGDDLSAWTTDLSATEPAAPSLRP